MKFDDTSSLSHTTWECKYHIVFAPKFRRRAEIVGIADLDNDGTDDLMILDTATDLFSSWKITDGQVNGYIAVV